MYLSKDNEVAVRLLTLLYAATAVPFTIPFSRRITPHSFSR